MKQYCINSAKQCSLANPLIGSKPVIGGLIGQFIIQFLNISGVEITSVDIDDSKKAIFAAWIKFFFH